MKQNFFDSNKISLDQINICSNQINFYLKSNQLHLWPYINALISLYWRKINLIQMNIYLVQRHFVWNKQILFHLNKSFLWSKESCSNKSFSLIQSNLFSKCFFKWKKLFYLDYLFDYKKYLFFQIQYRKKLEKQFI